MVRNSVLLFVYICAIFVVSCRFASRLRCVFHKRAVHCWLCMLMTFFSSRKIHDGDELAPRHTRGMYEGGMCACLHLCVMYICMCRSDMKVQAADVYGHCSDDICVL